MTASPRQEPDATAPKARSAKKFWWLGGALATVVVVVTAAIVVPTLFDSRGGQFEQVLEGECAPLAVLAFRGSGEGNLDPEVTGNIGAPNRYGDSELVTNGWEGITLTGLFDELSRTVVGDEAFRADAIPVIPVGPADASEPYGYDAILAALEASSLDSALSYSSSNLLASAQRGADAGTQIIADYLDKSAGCAFEPKFVVVGYSQGAMAARHTAELNPDSVLAVVNIGDPYQKPKATGVSAGGAAGTGIVRFKTSGDEQLQLDSFYDLAPYKSSICHTDDPICQFSLVDGLWRLAIGDYDQHLSYYSAVNPDEAPHDAGVIAELARVQWQLARDAAATSSEGWAARATAALPSRTLRGVSLSFAGTPTLVSAVMPGDRTLGVTYDFDLDGDGTFETARPDGTAFVTFAVSGPHQVGVRVTDPATGGAEERTLVVAVSPADEGTLTIDPATDPVAMSAPGSVMPGQYLPVTFGPGGMSGVGGGARGAAGNGAGGAVGASVARAATTPTGAVLFPLDGGVPIVLPAPTGTDGWSAPGLFVPASVRPGSYRLVVGVGPGRWLSHALAVSDQPPPLAAPPSVTAPAPRTPVAPVLRPAAPVPAPVVPAAPLPTTPPLPEPEPEPAPARAVVLNGVPVMAGGEFSVLGTNFAPGADVTLTADSLGIAETAVTDDTGSFAASLEAPFSATAATYTLSVTSGGVTTTHTFEVTAAPAAAPSVRVETLTVGYSFRITGTDFAAGVDAIMSFPGLQGTWPVSVDATGNFELTLGLGDERLQPGEQRLVVTQGTAVHEFSFVNAPPPA